MARAHSHYRLRRVRAGFIIALFGVMLLSGCAGAVRRQYEEPLEAVIPPVSAHATAHASH